MSVSEVADIESGGGDRTKGKETTPVGYEGNLTTQAAGNSTSLLVVPSAHIEGSLDQALGNTTKEKDFEDNATVQRELSKCACGHYPEVWYQFKRFETLGLLNLYYLQHELVNLEKRIIGDGNPNHSPSDTLENLQDPTLLRTLLKDYYSAVQLFENISQMKRPPMDSRRETAEILQRVLHEDYYTTAPDALGMLDLTPKALGVEPDSIRVLLTKTFTTRLSSFAPYTPRPRSEERTPVGEKARVKTQIFKDRPYAIQIPAGVDIITRLLVSIIAGFFLLVPMIIMSYITSKAHLLITACLFVLVFAVALSLASRATNQELMVATATYAAVLVVFVGQNIPI